MGQQKKTENSTIKPLSNTFVSMYEIPGGPPTSDTRVPKTYF